MKMKIISVFTLMLICIVFGASAGTLTNTSLTESFTQGGNSGPKNLTPGLGMPAGFSLETIFAVTSQIERLLGILANLILALLSQIWQLLGILANLILALMAKTGQLIGVIIGGLITYFTTTKLEKAKLDIGDRPKRQEVLSQLAGKNLMTKQHMESYFRARIFSHYYEALLNLKKNSTGLSNNGEQEKISQELQRSTQRCEELALECAKVLQNLFENIGLIQLLFPVKKTNLSRLIDQIYDIPEFKDPTDYEDLEKIKDEAKLEEWRDRSCEELKKNIEEKIKNPLNELFQNLRDEINAEPSKSKEP